MRKVKNINQTSNPSLLFARGIESLVSDHIERPRYSNEVKKTAKQVNATMPEPRGNFFSLLMRQFASN